MQMNTQHKVHWYNTGENRRTILRLFPEIDINAYAIYNIMHMAIHIASIQYNASHSLIIIQSVTSQSGSGACQFVCHVIMETRCGEPPIPVPSLCRTVVSPLSAARWRSPDINSDTVTFSQHRLCNYNTKYITL